MNKMSINPSKLPTILRGYFPILQWGLNYRREDLPGDITAGIIVASLLIPQAMAYAMLAGLPPQVGLYASIFPQVVYACVGTAKMLSVAPVAVDSLMVAAALGAIAQENTTTYLNYALILAGLVGIIEILLGILRLGFLVNFLSQAVISGFISAAAILIGLSQFKHLLGLKVPQTESFINLVQYLLQQIGNTNLITLVIGLINLIVLVYFQRYLGKQLKNWQVKEAVILVLTKTAPLIVVIGSSLIVAFLKLDTIAAVKIVGKIPQGISGFRMPVLDIQVLSTLIYPAIAISFVGFMEAFAVGKFLAIKKQQKIDANQELIALGAANLTAGFTGGYPITGGLSRSVVNFSAGANTPLAAIVTAAIIGLSVMFLTPLFYYLPQTSLAAVILVAVANLLDFPTLRHLWNYDKADAVAWIAAFGAVLLTNVEKGIIFGAVISLGLHLWRTSQPHIAIVGRVGETEHFRNVLRHSVTTYPDLLMVRVDESLYFVNTKYLETYLIKAVNTNPEVKHLVLVCSAVNLIDGSALQTLTSLIAELKGMGVQFYLAEVKGPVMDKLEKVGFVNQLGKDKIFLTAHQAMKTLEPTFSR